MIEEQRNNPLHGVKLEALLTELVEHYGWEALASALNLNCFKSNPSIKSSLKFLRKTLWAREKVEAFYLYKYKRLPKPDDTQYALPPRDRTVPLDQKPRSPAPITAAPRNKDRAPRTEARRSSAPESRRDSGKAATNDVWSKWRKKDSD